MELLSIGFKRNLDEINNILECEYNLINKDYYIVKEERKIGDTYFLEYKYDKSNSYEENEKIKNRFLKAISKIIIEIYQQDIINKQINNICYYLDLYEKKKLKEKAHMILKESDSFIERNMFYESDKYKIYNMLLDYFKENNEIILEGFVNFRLEFIVSKIEEIIDKLLAEFLLEQEYNEFIKILQYFVEIQEPKIRLVNVVIKKNNKYLLYDENKKLINNEYLEEIVDEMAESDMNYNDLLISSLITIAPREIVLHVDDTWANRDIIQIINNVFVDKVRMCNQCEFCSNKKEIKNKIENN